MLDVVAIPRVAAQVALGAGLGLILASAAASAGLTNIPVCTASFDQYPPVLVQDGAGGAIAVWQDSRAGEFDIYAQKVDPAGNPVWALDGVPVCKASGMQWFPRVVSDGAGGVIVVWQDARGGGNDIYAQRVSSIGVTLWTNGGVAVCTATNSQEAPTIVADGQGGALIAWADRRGADADVYVQRINASGAVQWAADGVALCTSAGDQTDLALVPDGQSGAIAAWKDQRGGAVDLYARRINASGMPQWNANGVVACGAVGDQQSAVATADGTGGMVLTWADQRGGNWDVYAQRMSGGGTTQWAADGVLLCGAAGDQMVPKLCSDGAGGAFVAWQDSRSGVTADIYARRVGDSGAAQWAVDGVVVCNAAGDQLAPSIFADPTGGVVVAWSDGRAVGNGLDIYIQHLNGTGAVQWLAGGVALCDTSGNQDLPQVVSDGQGGAAAMWRDYRAGTSADIYGQRIDATGAVPGQCPAATTDLLAGSVATTTAAQSYYSFTLADFYWSGVGVRSAAGSDWDLELYAPNTYGLGVYPTCFDSPVAGSYGSSGVDFVVGNFNPGHTPPDTYGARAFRYSGSGTAAVEWDFLATIASKDCTGANCGAKSATNWTGVLDVWDVYLFGGQAYTFDFTHTGSADIKFLLFSSYGSPGPSYFAPRSSALFQTIDRYTVYTAPSGEFYGIVLVNDNGLAGTYQVKINTGITVGVGDAAGVQTGLRGVAPNPSRGEARIHFSLREAGEVSFQVLDMAGRAVAKLPTQRWEAGVWSVSWAGRSNEGAWLSPGIYFVQMKVNGQRVGLGRLALVR